MYLKIYACLALLVLGANSLTIENHDELRRHYQNGASGFEAQEQENQGSDVYIKLLSLDRLSRRINCSTSLSKVAKSKKKWLPLWHWGHLN